MKNKIKKLELTQVIDSFDFNKVHSHMKETGWRWASAPKMGVPTLNDLKATARYLLTRVIQDKADTIHWARGGFVAHKSPSGIKLTFKFKS